MIDEDTQSSAKWAYYKLINESVSLLIYLTVIIYLLDMAVNMQSVLR